MSSSVLGCKVLDQLFKAQSSEFPSQEKKVQPLKELHQDLWTSQSISQQHTVLTKDLELGSLLFVKCEIPNLEQVYRDDLEYNSFWKRYVSIRHL